jgi:type IV fimbrial biogenesis protein FimT
MKKSKKPLKIVIRGFTLIELMVTLAVLSIVLGVGIPAFDSLITNGRLTSQINQSIGLISFARSEAAKRTGTTITVCGSTDEATCNTSNWEGGWLVMNDVDGDRTVDAGDGDILLRVGPALAGGNTLRTLGFGNAGFIQFDDAGSPGSAGTFILCDGRGAEEAKAIVLSIVGQSRTAVDEDANSIVNSHAGDDVTCP